MSLVFQFLPLVIVLPLLAAAGIGARMLTGQKGDAAEPGTARWALVAASLSLLVLFAAAVVAALDGMPGHIEYARWLESGSVALPFSVQIDLKSLVFAGIVQVVAVITLRFSRTYLHREGAFHRFFFGMSLFLAGMQLIVLAGDAAKTVRPSDATYMHYECELAVRIGKEAKGIQRTEAMAHVDAYAVANDYAIRDYLENYYRPNLKVKNRDGCTPLGLWKPAAQVPDYKNLALRTYVNGALTQDGNTRDMIFDIPFLIEYLSEFMTLRPGDIILTGTPEGLADVKAGDEVVTEIEGIGRLTNYIISE